MGNRLPFVFLVLFATVACREPTEILLSLETDVPCAQVKSFSYAFGTASEIESKLAFARINVGDQKFSCEPIGNMNRLGTLALIPAGAPGQRIGVRASVRFDSDAQDQILGDACTMGSAGCISQKIETDYLVGKTVRLTMALNRECAAVRCSSVLSCFTQGSCQSNLVTLTCSNSDCSVNTNNQIGPRFDGGVATAGGGSAGGGSAGGGSAGGGSAGGGSAGGGNAGGGNAGGGNVGGGSAGGGNVGGGSVGGGSAGGGNIGGGNIGGGNPVLDAGPDAGRTDAGVDGGVFDAGVPDAGPRLQSGLWVWQTEPLALGSRPNGALTCIAQTRNVNTLFMQATNITTAAGQASFTAFLSDAKRNGQSVELLFGDPIWALAANHSVAVNYALAAAAFTKGQDAGHVRPSGLHFDVEPYTLPNWTSDHDGTANQMLDLFEKLAPIAADAGLDFTVDIPFWYNEEIVARDGGSRPLSELVQDRVPHVVLMDYRDNTGTCTMPTVDGVAVLAMEEIAYADARGKKVTLGLEVNQVLPAKITFWEEGHDVLESVRATVACTYFDSPSFTGFAVHDWAAYRRLGPLGGVNDGGTIRSPDGGCTY
jgi:hypothetical protein